MNTRRGSTRAIQYPVYCLTQLGVAVNGVVALDGVGSNAPLIRSGLTHICWNPRDETYPRVKAMLVRSKAAILGALMLCLAVLILYVSRPDPPVWTLRTAFTIGTSVNPESVIAASPTSQGQIEGYRIVIALISTPVFRQTIADTSQFEPGSSALSKRLIFETLRAHDQPDNSIEIELTAASAADCRAAYRAVAEQIERRHTDLFEQNLKLLQASIDDYKDRSVQLKQWEDSYLQAGNQPPASEKDSKSGLGMAWNDDREHLRRLEAAKLLLTKTSFPPESQVYVNGPLSRNTVRWSALAGLAVLFAALLLFLGLERRQRTKENAKT